VRVLPLEDKPQGEKFIWAALNNRWWGGLSLGCKPSFSQALDSLTGESCDGMLVDLPASDLQGPDGLGRVGKVAQELPVKMDLNRRGQLSSYAGRPVEA
jgi:hypothetical protein